MLPWTTRSDGYDITYAVAAENVGQRRLGRIHALGQKGVGRVQRSELQLQQHLPWTRLGIRNLAQPKLLYALV